MRITLTGTGAAGGIPLYGCHCSLCIAARVDNVLCRKPASALVESGETRLLIDAGLMDLDKRYPAGSLSAILLTHYHPDHVQGLFHLRWGTGITLPVYGPDDPMGCADLFTHPGILIFNTLIPFKPISLGSMTITPLPMTHSKPTFGYAIASESKRVAYLCDTTSLAHDSLDFITDFAPQILVVDCTDPPGGSARNHHTLETVLNDTQRIKAKVSVLTHIGHDLGKALFDGSIHPPTGITVGFDGWISDCNCGR